MGFPVAFGGQKQHRESVNAAARASGTRVGIESKTSTLASPEFVSNNDPPSGKQLRRKRRSISTRHPAGSVCFSGPTARKTPRTKCDRLLHESHAVIAGTHPGDPTAPRPDRFTPDRPTSTTRSGPDYFTSSHVHINRNNRKTARITTSVPLTRRRPVLEIIPTQSEARVASVRHERAQVATNQSAAAIGSHDHNCCPEATRRRSSDDAHLSCEELADRSA